jgi:hypothetical protein
VGTTDSDERIERIVETRLVAGGAVSQYLVHWANSRSADDEWFDRADLLEAGGNTPALVHAFEKSHNLNKGAASASAASAEEVCACPEAPR